MASDGPVKESLTAETVNDTAESEAGTIEEVKLTTRANERLKSIKKYLRFNDILCLPSLYIGPVEPIKEIMWVYEEQAGMIQREISYAPGLQKIFDEILVNAVDNNLRDSSMDTLKVDIDPAKNVIKVFCKGKGIPVVEHDKEKMYVPSLVFCHSLTSFN